MGFGLNMISKSGFKLFEGRGEREGRGTGLRHSSFKSFKVKAIACDKYSDNRSNLSIYVDLNPTSQKSQGLSMLPREKTSLMVALIISNSRKIDGLYGISIFGQTERRFLAQS